MHRTTTSRLLTLCTILLALPSAARAQPLAERMPADAIVYAGWAGADSLGPQYDGSHLKAVLEASNVRELVDEFLPKVFERMGQQDPQAREALAGAASLGKLWHKPCAFAFTGVDLNNPRGGPVPRAVFVCQAGNDAASLRRLFDTAMQNRPPGAPPVPVKTFLAGDLVGFAVGYDRPEAALAQQGKSLVNSANFKSATGSVAAKGPAFLLYVDAEAGVKLINQAVEKSGDVQASEMWPRVREGAGLDGLKRVIWSEGFDGKEWGTRLFVEAPAPRRGVLALLGSQPLGDELLKAVPSTATVAGASRFDLVKFVDEVRTAVGKIDENGVAQFDAALEQASNMLGMDVRKEFLGALGDEWAYYTDPMTGGRGTMGLVMVNRLRDAAKAEQALTRIQSMIEAIVAQQMRQEKVRVSFRETKVNGVTLHFAATPFITPTWAVHQGNLYVGLYPQVVAAAASHSSRGGKGLADNKDFTALRQRLLAGAGNSAKAASVQFIDLPKTAPSSYQTWLVISSMARFGDMFGVESPDLLFPTMDVLMQHLTAAGSVSWADETGWHLRGLSPFPGSAVFAADSGGMMDVQTTAMMVSVLLPSLNRAREQANRVKSASNLRQIAQGVQMFANENKGRFPDEIGQLALTQDLQAEVFVNPRGSTSSPGALEPKDAAEWVRQSSDYVYVGKGKNYRSTQEDLLAYEKPDEMRDGINMVFCDGHVEFVPMEIAKQIIRAGRKGSAPRNRPAPGGGI